VSPVGATIACGAVMGDGAGICVSEAIVGSSVIAISGVSAVAAGATAIGGWTNICALETIAGSAATFGLTASASSV
jgi:hypothetical protein